MGANVDRTDACAQERLGLPRSLEAARAVRTADARSATSTSTASSDARSSSKQRADIEIPSAATGWPAALRTGVREAAEVGAELLAVERDRAGADVGELRAQALGLGDRERA